MSSAAKCRVVNIGDLIAAQTEQRERLREATLKMCSAGDASHAVDVLLDVIQAMQSDNRRLTARVNAALRARFGRRTEKLTPEEMGQLVLALGGSQSESEQPNPPVPVSTTEEEVTLHDEDGGEDAKEKSPKKRKKKRKSRKTTNISDEVQSTIIDLTASEEERTCVHCKAEMAVIDHVEHTRLEFHPAHFELVTRRREKVACKSCKQDINTAADITAEAARNHVAAQRVQPLTDRDQPTDKTSETNTTPAAFNIATGDACAAGAGHKRRVGVSLLAHLIEAKCGDALPIHRQREQFMRYGVTFPANTLYGYTKAALQILQPVGLMILSSVLGAEIVGVDDTRLDYLIPKEKSRIKRGHLWCFVSPGAMVAFDFTQSWAAADIAPLLHSIDGYIQCDDYKGYRSKVSNGVEEVPLVDFERRLGCMMHVRRRYHRALKSGEADAIIVIGHIKAIYAVEQRATRQVLSAQARHALRQRESLPHLRAMHDWNDANKDRLRPSSYLGEAVRYAQDQRVFIDRCFTDGRFAIDNGSVERQIRKPAIGRKNYLFSGSPEAASLLAIGYTVISTCHNLGIPTRDYLIDVMTRLEAGHPLSDIGALRPDRWAIQRGLLPPGDYLHQKVAK